LRYFVAFQDAASVLAIPLRAGFENYGVLLFGSEQPNAFSRGSATLLTAVGTQATIAFRMPCSMPTSWPKRPDYFNRRRCTQKVVA